MSASKTNLFCMVAFVCATVCYATPPKVVNPYIVKSYKVSPTPEIDKWSTVEIVLECIETPIQKIKKINISSAGIELNLPVPENKPKLLSNGIPYSIERNGREGQLADWVNIEKGAVHRISFQIRPYWFGDLKFSIQGIAEVFWIGMGQDGKAVFTGTETELSELLGPMKASGKMGSEILTYSEEQSVKRESLLGIRNYIKAKSYPQKAIQKAINMERVVGKGEGLIKSTLAYGDILRIDYIVDPLPKKGQEATITVSIKTRNAKDNIPSIKPCKNYSTPNAVIRDSITNFQEVGDGVYSAQLVINLINESTQAIDFKLVNAFQDSKQIQQLPVYGLYLNFDENGICTSIK